jgi:hypothetical protein
MVLFIWKQKTNRKDQGSTFNANFFPKNTVNTYLMKTHMYSEDGLL